MRLRKGNHSHQGFTLLEVMIAATVLILVFVSAIGALMVGFRLLEDARLNTLASQVLQSEVENLRLKNWAQLEALPSNGSFTVETSLNTASFSRFSCTRAISDLDANLKQIVLTLRWNSMDGRQHDRRYLTYIAKDGLNDYYYRTF